jgi:hypothetical protein
MDRNGPNYYTWTQADIDNYWANRRISAKESNARMELRVYAPSSIYSPLMFEGTTGALFRTLGRRRYAARRGAISGTIREGHVPIREDAVNNKGEVQ